MFRVGIGYDTHRLEAGRPLILAGLRIEYPLGLAGHSDADVILHAVTDALLGAVAQGDIGDRFPDEDPRWLDADSSLFLRDAMARVHEQGYRLVNVDVIVFAQKPKLGPLKEQLRERLAHLVGLDVAWVSVKAKTGEGVGIIGRGEAISSQAVVLIEKA